MTVSSLHIIGIILGLSSAVGSAVIAIVLAGEKQIPTIWVLLIQSSVALFVSCTIPAARKFAGRGRLWHESESMDLRTGRYGKHLLRAIAGLAIYGFYYQSLKLTPKVDCSLLLNTSPLFVPFLCVVAFGDRAAFRAWIGVAIGFAGVAIILMPGASFRTLEFGHLLALFAGIAFACSTVLVCDLNKTEPVATTVYFYNLHSVIGLLVAMAAVPQPIGLRDIAICFGIGLVFCIKQYAITMSIKHASATTAAMLNFATIPMLTLYGAVCEGEPLCMSALLGTGLVAIGVPLTIKPPRF